MVSKKNKIISALILNFALSWGLAGIAKLMGLTFTGITAVIIGIIYMFMPTLSLVILSRFFWKTPLKEWGVKKPKNHFLFLAILFPFILAGLTIVISLLVPGIKFQPGMEGIFAKYADIIPAKSLVTMKSQIITLGPWLPLLIILESLIGGLTINSIAAFGEEFFWRGFLLKQLKKYGWFGSSFIIGTIWGIWHAPLILQGHNYPFHPLIGVFMMILWCELLSFPLIFFTIKTQSVLTAAIFHGVINGTAGLTLLWISGGTDLTVGMTGLTGFAALLILNLGLIFIDKKSTTKINYLLAHDY